MARYNRTPRLTLAQQQLRINQIYPSLIESIGIRNSQLSCDLWLQPTAESIKYKVSIKYKIGCWPTAQIVEPREIEKVDGQKPHHLYNRNEDGKEKLCVFHPKSQEWNDAMFLTDAFIPWVITWLSAYEIWQITGIWVYPEAKDNKPKQESKKCES